jgi:uncharacterized protein DUF1902
MSIATVSIGDRSIAVNVHWDSEAGVWIATGRDIHGLVVEADTWPALIEEIELVTPELLELLSV